MVINDLTKHNDGNYIQELLNNNFECNTVAKFQMVTGRYVGAIIQLKSGRDKHGNMFVLGLKQVKDFFDKVRKDYAVLEPIEIAIIIQGNSDYILNNVVDSEKENYKRSIRIVQDFFSIRSQRGEDL